MDNIDVYELNRQPNKNKNLHNAKRAKNDEFYTQLADIERELSHYREYFKGKVVLCNCDDPYISGFFEYFSLNFEALQLKKLITTCYKNNKLDLFTQQDQEQAIYLEYYGDKNGNRVPDVNEIGVKALKGDGDFRSAECIELLKEADVVVTNPPFSLFREYVAQLMEYKKDFLIIGNLNAISYKEVFPLIKDNRVWLGPSIYSGGRKFEVPAYCVDEKRFTGEIKDGKYYQEVMGVRWFTNILHKKRNEELRLFKKYKGHEKEYPKYDNYNAIEVSKVINIPIDFKGVMGVPISFLDKYNPKQFEILGQMANTKIDDFNFGYPFIKGERKYARILIKRR